MLYETNLHQVNLLHKAEIQTYTVAIEGATAMMIVDEGAIDGVTLAQRSGGVPSVTRKRTSAEHLPQRRRKQLQRLNLRQSQLLPLPPWTFWVVIRCHQAHLQMEVSTHFRASHRHNRRSSSRIVCNR
jgi:hypothetical protein